MISTQHFASIAVKNGFISKNIVGYLQGVDFADFEN